MYKVVLIADNHFIKDNDNFYVNGTYTQQYLKRFTSNFDLVTVIGRTRNVTDQDDVSKLRLSGGERVDFLELPDFNGVKNYIKIKSRLKKQMLDNLKTCDAVFVRMPCILTTLAFECAKKLNLPVMIDVGADPNTIYRSSKTTIFELIISKYMQKVCQKNCMSANGVSYVTKKVLQEKYPCKALVLGESEVYFTAAISNADISEDFYTNSRVYSELIKKELKLLHISNNICSNSGKGHIEAIEVLKGLVNNDINCSLTFVGGGQGIDEIKAIAHASGVGDRIHFTGRIADRGEYKSIIMSHDIFIFPSHSEGLPRVLLETMATGMVCVSSNVDGIPEILEADNIFNYSDTAGMTKRIIELIHDVESMNNISVQNIKVAREYSNTNLKKVYDLYYAKVRKLIDVNRIKVN